MKRISHKAAKVLGYFYRTEKPVTYTNIVYKALDLKPGDESDILLELRQCGFVHDESPDRHSTAFMITLHGEDFFEQYCLNRQHWIQHEK